MLTDTLAEELSQRLLEAERHRTPVEPLTDSHPDLNQQEAYRIQDTVVGAREEAVVGYKMGFTSEAMREQMGIPEPNYGQLTGGMWVDADAGPVGLSGLIHPRVEPEIAVLVEKDLYGPELTPAKVYPAVRWTFSALEVVDSRFIDYRFRLQDNTADNSSAARFVLGNPVPLTSASEPRLAGVVLWKDGHIVGRGAGAGAMGDPLRTITWLAKSLGESGRVLEEGSVVLTGGLTPAHPVGEGGTFVAEFGGLGTVKVYFSEEV